MRPLLWLEKVDDWLRWNLWWRWVQCKAELEWPLSLGASYCIRYKGHRGQHRTFAGERFL